MNHKTSITKKPVWLASLMVVLVMVLAACQSAATVTVAPTVAVVSATETPSVQSMPAAAGPAKLMVADDPKLGKILVDGMGMTLYIYTKDTPDQSNCTGGCLAKWPPFLTMGAPMAGAGIDASLLGTAALADGSIIVTYNHMPLYYWVNDTKPGDATGQGVGNVWYVLAPDGKAIGMSSVASANPTATPSGQSMPAAAGPASLMVATDPKLGQILVDGKGMTLYMYTKDEPDKSNCTGKCLAAWPPFLTVGAPVAGTGVDASLIGTAKLADGSTIVTYNHMPLYYWAKDTKAGDATGQGVGNVWYVLAPDGKVVGMSSVASANPTATPSGAEGYGSSSGSTPTIMVATDPKLGKILVDGKGRTLYIFTNDQPDKSNCTGDCLVKWPPLLTTGAPVLGDGIDPSLAGTATLADGSMIVTYNKMPLYYWYQDAKAGDVNGEGVGSVWYVIGPDGNPITN